MLLHFLADAGNSAANYGVPAFAATQLGLSGVFLWQWRDEKTQRMKRDDQLLALTQQLSPLVIDAVRTMREFDQSVRDTITRFRAMPEAGNLDVATRRVELLADALTGLATKLDGKI